MDFQLIPTLPEQRDEIRAFLQSVFRIQDEPFIEPRVLDWKYYDPHPEAQGSRSFVVRDENGAIASHLAYWPLWLTGPAGARVSAVHLIDWAASTNSRGAGGFIYRELGARFDVMIVVGGSPQAQKVLPKLGLVESGRMDLYARVVRPFSQWAARRSPWAWKSIALCGRNLLWSTAGAADIPESWSATAVSSFPATQVESLNSERTTAAFTCTGRTAAWLDYAARCPAVTASKFVIENNGALIGYFLITRAGPQARIADLFVKGGPAEWTAAYALATRMAAADPLVCEIVAGASMDFIARALSANGYRVRAAKRIYYKDPEGYLPRVAPLALQFTDSDAFFLYTPRDPFLT